MSYAGLVQKGATSVHTQQHSSGVKGDSKTLHTGVNKSNTDVKKTVGQVRQMLGMYPELAAALADIQDEDESAGPPPAPESEVNSTIDEADIEPITVQKTSSAEEEIQIAPGETECHEHEPAAMLSSESFGATTQADLHAQATAEEEAHAAAEPAEAEAAAIAAAQAEAFAIAAAQAEADRSTAEAAVAEAKAAQDAEAAAKAAQDAADKEDEETMELAKEEKDLGMAEKRGKSGGLNNPGWKPRKWKACKGVLTYMDSGAVKGTIALKGASIDVAAAGQGGADRGVCLTLSTPSILTRKYMVSLPDKARADEFMKIVRANIKYHTLKDKKK